jgi:hypothetical protein
MKKGGPFEIFPKGIWCLRAVQTPPSLGGPDLRRCEVADFDRERLVHSLLLSAAKFREQFRHRDGIAAFTLTDRLEKHFLGGRIGLKGLVSFVCENGDRCAFRQIGIQFDTPTDDFPGCDLHEYILAVSSRGRS